MRSPTRAQLPRQASAGDDAIVVGRDKRVRLPVPDLSRTSEHSVWVTLHGEIQDPEFLRFLEEIGKERLAAPQT